MNIVTPSSSILDRSTYNKKVLSRLITSPLTLGPILLGATILMALWTFSINIGAAIFGGLLCILGGVGAFFSRFFLGKEEINKKILAEMQKEAQVEREKMLIDLEKRLRADGDPRTEESLCDLIALAKAFQKHQSWGKMLNARSTFDILEGVERLFNRCLFSLERTLELWYTAKEMVTPESREPVLKQREQIVEDVRESIKQLGKILAGIHSIGLDSDKRDSELAHIRQELDQSLEVARQVEKRMDTLDREIGVTDFNDN